MKLTTHTLGFTGKYLTLELKPVQKSSNFLHKLVPAFLFLFFLTAYSCRTCNCPAYSLDNLQAPELNKAIPEMPIHNFELPYLKIIADIPRPLPVPQS